MDKVLNQNLESYKELLENYIDRQDERSLYIVERMSKSFIKNSVLPEEIVNLHIQAMDELYPNLSHSYHHSMNFLLEAMISYGLAHQEFQSLREQQIALKSEISIAASMQETLLKTDKPDIDGLDIGVISVPAHQMNGDYYHFIKGKNGMLGLAIADVIGKGIPAALSMSMIKYSIDSYPEESMRANVILENLNRVVERNAEPNMFITMIYAQYLPEECKLKYAFAGHEPGYYFNSRKNTFDEINTKGLVLGVLPNSTYTQKELVLQKDDMIIFLTDGVTECKDNGRFIEIQEVLNLIRQYKDLPAQEIVNNLYKYFEKLQDFRLRDDFTMVILKKQV